MTTHARLCLPHSQAPFDLQAFCFWTFANGRQTRDRKQREPLFRKERFSASRQAHVPEHHGTRSGASLASSDRNAHFGQRCWRTFERLSLRHATLDEKRTRVGSCARRFW